MAITDRYGLPVTTISAVAAERFQEGMDRLLSFSAGAEACFAAAVEADEGLALAHGGVALVAVVQGDAATARTAAETARRTVAGATRRERQHVEALSALVGGETARGLDLVDEHVAEFPRDALLVNQTSSAIGLGGRSDREQFRAAFLERLAPAYGDDWWFHSALGFAYHEVGRLEESRRLSERSLQQYPGNANATHNIAHVCFETAELDAADDERWADGERDAAGRRDDGPAWRTLADLAARVSRPGFVFGEIHAALAYARSGDTTALTKLIDGLRDVDAKGHPIAGTVALPLVRGIAAFVAGVHAGALAHFKPVEEEIHRVGGRHAQWELFEETMVACYLRLGRHDDALRLMRRRLQRRASPRDVRWLDRARTPGDAPSGAS